MKNKLSKTKLISKIIGYTLFFIVFGYILFYSVFNLIKPNLTTKFLGFKPYVILTQSMEPKIKPNDVVITVKHDFEDLKSGDIITFVDPKSKKVVTHYFDRYDATTDNSEGLYIRTKNNKGVDIWKIDNYHYIGKVSTIIPSFGLFFKFFQSPIGIFLFIVIVAIIIAIFVVVSKLIQHKKNNKKEITNKEEIDDSKKS